jgi:uncharacterized protein GlcG (DUF336 family)
MAMVTMVESKRPTKRSGLPTHEQLRTALIKAQQTDNGGLGNHMWAAVVDRSGIVMAVAYSGKLVGDQWPGSRIIAAQKANTANGLSLDTLALSTANLYAGVQATGPLFGLLETNQLNIHAAYDGDPANAGTERDPMVGKQIGGIVVFGGGLALYDASGHIIGGLGVSGDLSCADHNIAWKLRHLLELDYVPSGVDPVNKLRESKDDNIVYDLDPKTDKSKSGWGHPKCTEGTTKVAKSLPAEYPIRKPSKSAREDQ